MTAAIAEEQMREALDKVVEAAADVGGGGAGGRGGFIKPKVEAIHMSGRVLDTLLQLCDGMVVKDKGKARLYNKVFVWASSHGEWANWDEWRDDDKGRNVVPEHVVKQTFIVDADKPEIRAITQLIDDAMKKGGMLMPSIRMLDQIYKQVAGESLIED